MAQVLITGLLTFLLLQLAACQDPACLNALSTLSNNSATCTDTVICTGQCRQHYEAVITNCDENTAAAQQLALDTYCAEGTKTSTTNTQQCNDAMAELLANADRCPPETDDTAIICSGECQSYFDNFVRYCAPDSLDEFNAICENSGNGNSSGVASIFKGLGMFSFLLSMIAAVVF